MKTELPVKKTESFFDEMERFRDRFMRNTYGHFWDRNAWPFFNFDDWFGFEGERPWKPAVEMTEKDNAFLLKVAIPGMDPKELEIHVTGDDVLIKAEHKEEAKPDEKGKVYFSEFKMHHVFRSVHFPKKVNPDKVVAEYRNGMLVLTAPLAEGVRERRVEIKAA